MPAFVAQNPQLEGRKYCNVLRGTFFDTPAAVPVPSGPPGSPS